MDSKDGFRFGDTFVRSRGMVQLVLTTSGSTLDILVLLDFVHVEISALLGLDFLDSNKYLLNNVINHV